MPNIFSRPADIQFAGIFNDASRCPVTGDYQIIGRDFSANCTTPLTPQDLRERVDLMARNYWPVAVIVTHQRKSKVYVCPAQFNPLVGGSPFAGKMVAFNGELGEGGHPYYSHLQDEVFNKTTQVITHTAEDTHTKFSDDASLEILGPHSSQDQGMEKIYTRRVCYVPHFLVNFFLAKEDGMTVREFWTTVYPVITAEGKAAACKELIEYFQVLATAAQQGGTASAAEVAAPMPDVGKDMGVIEFMRKTLLHRLFPQRDELVANVQQNALFETLARGVADSDRRYQEEKQFREEERAKNKSLAHRLGEERAKRILRATGCATEGELFLRCPMWKKIAESTGKEEGVRAAIQDAVDGELNRRGATELNIRITPAKAILMTKEPWYRENTDQVDTGWFSNFLLHGATTEEFEASVIELSARASDHQYAPLLDDVAKLLRLKVYLPTVHEVEFNLKRMEIMASVALPADHNFRTYLMNLIKRFDVHKFEFVRYNMYSDVGNNAAKGIYFLEFLSLQANSYWRTQSREGGNVTAPNFEEYFTLHEQKRDWVPRMSRTYEDRLQLHKFTGIPKSHELVSSGATHGSAVQVHAPAGATASVSAVAAPLAPAGSGVTLPGAGGDLLNRLLADLASGKAPSQRGGQSTSVKSDTYEAQGGKLFGKFKRRKDPSTGKEFAISKVKLNADDNAPIPVSKHCQGPMCLAWHVKGMCNTNCPRAGDHKPYSDQDYKPLIEWCDKHYPGKDE